MKQLGAVILEFRKHESKKIDQTFGRSRKASIVWTFKKSFEISIVGFMRWVGRTTAILFLPGAFIVRSSVRPDGNETKVNAYVRPAITGS